MLERFSDRARMAVERATEEAARLRHPHVGTEHLLLGLLRDEASPAADVLRGVGATFDGARQKVAEAVAAGAADGADPDDGDERPFTARARRALERAGRFSLQRRDAEVGTVHVLLGVLDVEGTAGQVLRGLGVDVGRLPDTVDPARTDDRVEPVHAPAASSTVGRGAKARCGGCGEAVTGGLVHRVMDSHGDGEPDRRMLVVSCPACGSVLGVTPLP